MRTVNLFKDKSESCRIENKTLSKAINYMQTTTPKSHCVRIPFSSTWVTKEWSMERPSIKIGGLFGIRAPHIPSNNLLHHRHVDPYYRIRQEHFHLVQSSRDGQFVVPRKQNE